jgi:hypothetical protein
LGGIPYKCNELGPSVITKDSALVILMGVEIFRASFAGSSECGPGKTWAGSPKEK